MSEELREKIYLIMFSNPEPAGKLDEIMSLIKQERIRYGEWLIGEDDKRVERLIEHSPASVLIRNQEDKPRNDLRAELRQRNKGEI